MPSWRVARGDLADRRREGWLLLVRPIARRHHPEGKGRAADPSDAVRAAPDSREGTALRGILCERDVIRKCLCAGRDPATTRVAEVMTPDPVTVAADQGLVEALRLMTDGRFHHLPVIEDGSVIALLSIQDIPAEYRMMAERFEEYRSTGG